MDATEIILELDQFINWDYAGRKVGVTGDPARSWKTQGQPDTWQHWRADDEQAAQIVEDYFKEKGCELVEGTAGSFAFVFVY